MTSDLATSHPRCIGRRGLGNEESKLVQALGWFNGQLYVGLTHHYGYSADYAGRIVRLDVASGQWHDVHVSPLRDADDRVLPQEHFLSGEHMLSRRKAKVAPYVPVYRGIRAMTTCRTEGDSADCLYVSTLSHWGGQVLRSEDGVHFEPVSAPGMGDINLLSLRGLTAINGRLFAGTAGSLRPEGIDRNFCDLPRVYCSGNPVSANWDVALDAAQLNPAIKGIGALAVFNGQLYAGCSSYRTGFQLWRAEIDGPPPYRWHPVITDGAARYVLNERPVAMAVFGDALYIGTGLPGLGHDKIHDVGPAAAELIRVTADDRWELIMGRPRCSAHGLQVARSGLGCGFDDNWNAAIWSLASANGQLYVGTNNWRIRDRAQRNSDPKCGGGQLWSSMDGNNWEAVDTSGFGNPYNMGVSRLLGCPLGLVAGLSNHQEVDETQGMGHLYPGRTGAEFWLIEGKIES